MINGNHPWKLVAPWYRWARQRAESGVEPRATRPVFQKFDEPGFVKSFVSDPQRSYQFKDSVDRVFKIDMTSVAPPSTGIFAGRFTRLYAPKVTSGTREAFDTKLVPTGIRKLFLDVHKRYYLVVCELHCDAAGFPTATPDQVCQAGFVVRRRFFGYSEAVRKEAVARLGKITSIQGKIADLEQTSPAKGLLARRRARVIEEMKSSGAFVRQLSELNTALDGERAALRVWREENGVTSVLEGWIPSAIPNVGSWQLVEDEPQRIFESTYPLFALFPDPKIAGHSAKGKTIYYGVIPTSSLDTDERGGQRLDSQSLYEVRCFVRQHRPGCPRGDQAPDCSGTLYWSLPTESFMLAAPADLVGTSQRPVTIQMPDLAELAAQAAALDTSQLSPVKVVQPQAMRFNVDGDGKPTGGSVGGAQICFFSIPLITIVAMFLLNLFLPIVVFLFGLYFLLALKFCIPPSIAIDADLNAQLQVLPPGIDVDASFDVSLGLPLTAQQMNDRLRDTLANQGGVSGAQKAELGGFSNAAMIGPAKSVVKGASGASAAAGPQLTASLELEPRVEAVTV